jgi:hypothetical protein
MRPNSIFIITFLCIPTLHLLAQSLPFAPIGARWHYRPYEQVPDRKLYTFTVTKDTLLDGVLARELSCAQWANGQFQAFPNLNKYVYSNPDSVFYYVDNQWKLIFDFAALPGDTIRSQVEHFDIPNGCVGPNSGKTWAFAYRIDSIGVENIGGRPLRVQYVRSLCPNSNNCWIMGSPGATGKIVERIGAIQAGYWWGQSTTCVLGGFPGYLRCYGDALIQYTGSIGSTSCGYVGTNELEAHNISITQNPTNGSLYFSFLPLSANLGFQIFDGLGRTLKTGALMTGESSLQIDLESEPSGMYYVGFTLKGQTQTLKVIKK